jgi:hypothetical protein
MVQHRPWQMRPQNRRAGRLAVRFCSFYFAALRFQFSLPDEVRISKGGFHTVQSESGLVALRNRSISLTA